MKGSDTAARYGGEEFGVILPKTELTGASRVADDIRARMAKQKLVNHQTGEQIGAITLSIGVASYRSGEPPANLIARADSALYAAKGRGRNRVLVETDL